MKIAYIDKKFRGATLNRIERADQIINEYRAQGYDLTVRQLYYQFVARGWLGNSDRNYKMLANNLNDARLAGLIDWTAIVDRTRSMRSRSHWDSPEQIVKSAAAGYHKDMWEPQPYRVETWIEKDALAGVFNRVCQDWDVPYLSCRGYPSQTVVWRASMRYLRWIRGGQEVVLLHFTDHDPSGLDMTRDLESRFSLFLGDEAYRLSIQRMALTINQVNELNPPPNPAKMTDARASDYVKLFGEHSWELDALPPDYLSKRVLEGVDSVVDPHIWDLTTQEIDYEREQLYAVADNWDEISVH